MGCDFTEEVSLLVDGELSPPAAERLAAHVEGCASCKQAREAFLLLRQELRSYERAPDPHTQSRALAAILGSHTSGAEAAAPPTGVRAASTPDRIVGRLSERLTEAFGVRRLRPAHVAALATLLIGTALGVRWLVSSNAPRPAQPPGASTVASSLPAQAGRAEKSADIAGAVTGPAAGRARTSKAPSPDGAATPRPGRRESARLKRDGSRPSRQGREGLGLDARLEPARVVEPTARPSSAAVNAPYTTGSLRAADDPSLRVGRHTERVERLLRSFRNARLTEGDPTLDVADARRLSKRLLYNNIALRREAAGAGDTPVEGLLDSVEPILIDISNLPDAPSQEAVGSIKERINRKQLVGVLQAQGMLAAR